MTPPTTEPAAAQPPPDAPPDAPSDTAPVTAPLAEGPIVHTARLIMRPLGPQDLHAMHDVFSRDDVLRHLPKAKLTIAERSPWLTTRSTPPAFNFALYLRGPDGQPAGPAIGALGTPRNPPMVGYAVHPDQWGKGLVSEALAAYEKLFWAWVPSAFADGPGGGGADAGRGAGEGEVWTPGLMARAAAAGPAYDYIHAFCNVDNIGSRRVLEKAGFTCVSVRDEDHDGKMVGVYRFAKARPGRTLEDVGIVVEI